MKRLLSLLLAILFVVPHVFSQTEPGAGKWKTWFLTSGKDVQVPQQPTVAQTKEEVKSILTIQQRINDATLQKILYWNTGAPSYRWREVLQDVTSTDTSGINFFTVMLLNGAVYDAIVAAWKMKYEQKRLRPFEQDKRIKLLIVTLGSPSYPCEYSVAAGVATTLITHFFPGKADSVKALAREAMEARIASGAQYPSDTKAGFDLGEAVAKRALEKTKDFLPAQQWDGKMPAEEGRWKGKSPTFPMWAKRKTVVLTSASQFRPGPPPDYKAEMEELKNFKPTFRSTLNAFQWASGTLWRELVDKKIFEYNLHLNPPKAERIYALRSIAAYDGQVACWDAKYAYWGIRPAQYDTTFHPSLMGTPNFPGYPSAHAVTAGASAELLSEFFPREKEFFWAKAKEAAESRFEGGVHFRSDNVVGLEMGKKIGELVLQKAKANGSGVQSTATSH